MSSEGSLLPEDWRQRSDWAEQVIAAVVGAWREGDVEKMLEAVEVGEELAHADVSIIPDAIATLAALSALNISPSDLPDAVQALQELAVASYAERLIAEEVQSLLAAYTLRLAARTMRNSWDAEGDLIGRKVVGAYARASQIFDDLDIPRQAAITRQSQSAVLFELGEIQEAERLALQILPYFEATGALQNQIGVLLNLIQYSISTRALADASKRLKLVEPLVDRLRDGHFRSAFLEAQAQVAIQSGNPEAAEPLLRRALDSARRRGEVSQQLDLLHDLSVLSQELGRPRETLRWLRQSARAASGAIDPKAQQRSLRSLGVYLADAGRFAEAHSSFLAAAELNDARGFRIDAARCRADAAAVLTSIAIKAYSSAERERSSATRARYPTASQIDAAQASLLSSFDELVELRDAEWIGRVGRNLETLWVVNERTDRAASFFAESVDRVFEVDSSLAVELLVSAAHTGQAAQRSRDWILGQYLRAAEIEQSISLQPGSGSWQLARSAAEVGARFEDWELSRALFDIAREGFREIEDWESYASIQNDAAIASENLGDLDESYVRLLDVRFVAHRDTNRVLAALATHNLGELELHRGNVSEGRTLLRESVQFSLQIGDLEAASSAWSSISVSHLASNEVDEAVEAQRVAERIAFESASPPAIARALSCQGSIEFTLGNYEKARAAWSGAARLVEDSGKYLSFGLETWAVQGNWPGFSRALKRYVTRAQKSHQALDYSRNLGRSLAAWLNRSETRRAARTAASALLLATDGYMRLRGRERTMDAIARGDKLMVEFLSLYSAVEMLRREAKLGAADDALFARIVREQFREAGGEAAVRILAQILRVVTSAIDDDDDGPQAELD